MKRVNVFKGLLKGAAIILATSFMLTSCSSEEEEVASTKPDEALVNFVSNNNVQMVMSIRLGDLIDKSGVKGDLLPAEIRGMVDVYMNQFLDSDATGLDLGGTSYFVFDMEGMRDQPNMMGLFVPISDGEKFGSFLESKSHMTAEEGEGYKFISLPGGAGVVAWTNGTAIVLAGNAIQKGGSGKVKDMIASIASSGKNKTTELKKFMAKKADIGMYMDYEKYMDALKDMPGVSDNPMMNSDMMKMFSNDAYFSGFINFENGKITFDSEFNGNKEFTKMMNSMYKNGNPEFANYLGGEDLIGFFTMSLNIGSLLDMYEKSGFFDAPDVKEGLAQMKEKTGLSIRDVANKFTGDFSFAMVGINEGESENEEAPANDNPYAGYYEESKESVPVFTIAIGINDSVWGPILDTISKLTKVKNMYTFEAIGEGKGGMCVKNNILFLTSDITTLEDFALDGRLNTYTKNNAQNSIKNNSMYGYFDFGAFSDAMVNVDPEVATAVSALDYAELMFDKNNTVFKGTLHMADKNTNSLKALLKMVIASAEGGNLF